MQYKYCIYCRRVIPYNDTVCPYCNRSQTFTSTVSTTNNNQDSNSFKSRFYNWFEVHLGWSSVAVIAILILLVFHFSSNLFNTSWMDSSADRAKMVKYVNNLNNKDDVDVSYDKTRRVLTVTDNNIPTYTENETDQYGHSTGGKETYIETYSKQYHEAMAEGKNIVAHSPAKHTSVEVDDEYGNTPDD